MAKFLILFIFYSDENLFSIKSPISDASKLTSRSSPYSSNFRLKLAFSNANFYSERKPQNSSLKDKICNNVSNKYIQTNYFNQKYLNKSYKIDRMFRSNDKLCVKIPGASNRPSSVNKNKNDTNSISGSMTNSMNNTNNNVTINKFLKIMRILIFIFLFII